MAPADSEQINPPVRGQQLLLPPHPDGHAPAFLTEKQLAERWAVSVKFIQNQRYEGRGVAYHKLGSAVRYRLDDVIAFEQECRRTSTSQGDGQ